MHTMFIIILVHWTYAPSHKECKFVKRENENQWQTLSTSTHYRATAITAEQAQDAMIQFVSEHCCYGTAPAREMVIKDVVPSSAYHVSTIFLLCPYLTL